jgi:hypothetical protein
MCTFPVFIDGACVRAPCIVIAHPDFITGCIVLYLLEIIFGHFWSMGELIAI